MITWKLLYLAYDDMFGIYRTQCIMELLIMMYSMFRGTVHVKIYLGKLK